MTAYEMIIQARRLREASSKINQAMETYEEAVETAKNTASDLASKWEGASKDAFVEHQENAYSWHKQIMSVVRNMVSVISQAIQQYEQMEDAVKNLMKG